jgi:hypothetical protein
MLKLALNQTAHGDLTLKDEICFGPHARFAESRNRRASVALFPLIRIIVTLFSVPRESSLIKSKKIRKPSEGSLHPKPEGRGIRDSLRSRCNKKRKGIPLICLN